METGARRRGRRTSKGFFFSWIFFCCVFHKQKWKCKRLGGLWAHFFRALRFVLVYFVLLSKWQHQEGGNESYSKSFFSPPADWKRSASSSIVPRLLSRLTFRCCENVKTLPRLGAGRRKNAARVSFTLWLLFFRLLCSWYAILHLMKLYENGVSTRPLIRPCPISKLTKVLGWHAKFMKFSFTLQSSEAETDWKLMDWSNWKTWKVAIANDSGRINISLETRLGALLFFRVVKQAFNSPFRLPIFDVNTKKIPRSLRNARGFVCFQVLVSPWPTWNKFFREPNYPWRVDSTQVHLQIHFCSDSGQNSGLLPFFSAGRWILYTSRRCFNPLVSEKFTFMFSRYFGARFTLLLFYGLFNYYFMSTFHDSETPFFTSTFLSYLWFSLSDENIFFFFLFTTLCLIRIACQ